MGGRRAVPSIKRNIDRSKAIGPHHERIRGEIRPIGLGEVEMFYR